MLDRICNALSLGALSVPPMSLSGGFTHRMFRVETDKGSYALKLLNPEIMQRPDALDNYRAAEKGESLMENAGVPILPALSIGGRKLQRVDGQYLYVFDYFDGQPLQDEEITPAHCAKIGAVLARIHGIDQRSCEAIPPAQPIDWPRLVQDLLAASCSEGALLQGVVPLLERVTAAAQEAICRLPMVETLCHNDMDPKNVLWRGEEFRIIDLESSDTPTRSRKCSTWRFPGAIRRRSSKPSQMPTLPQAEVPSPMRQRCTTAAATTSTGWRTMLAAR